MNFDALILDSGEWLLARELPGSPLHLLVYTQRGAPRNELHVWLPRRDDSRRTRYAFKRFWEASSTRWCVEIPAPPARPDAPPRSSRVRFSSPDGRVLWAENPRRGGLADLSDADLARLLRGGRPAPYVPA